MAFSDSLLILLLALAAEAAIGYPDGLYTRIGHPVTWIGRLIKGLDRGLNRDEWTFGHRRAAGILALLILLTITGGVAWVLQSLLLPLGMIGVAVLAILASSLLAQRSLHQHVAAVSKGLREGGIEGGRKAVSMIVGRNPQSLDEAGVSRAAIESLAENFSDGIVAPAFWLGLGGLPGAVLYKATNTAERNGLFASHPETQERIGKVKQLAGSKPGAVVAARYTSTIKYQPTELTKVATVVEGSAGLAAGSKEQAKPEEKKAEEKKAEEKKKGGFGLGNLTK